MSSRVEIGRGGQLSTINLFDIAGCQPQDCEYRINPDDYNCIRHNGNATIIFHHGITKETPKIVTTTALCIKK